MPPEEDASLSKQLMSWIKSKFQGGGPETPDADAADASDAPPAPKPPVDLDDPAAVLRFAQEAPLTLGFWRYLKGFYKQAEADQNPELLGILIGRLDAAPFPGGPNQTATEQSLYEEAWDVAVSGQYAYVLTGDLWGDRILRVLDISNPLRPVEVHQDKVGTSGKMLLSDNHLFLFPTTQNYYNKNHLLALDVTDPAQPRKFRPLKMDMGMGIAMCGGHLLLTENGGYRGQTGLKVLDVSDSPPRQIGFLAIQNVGKVVASGSMAYVLCNAGYYDGRGQLRVVTLADPAKPMITQSLDMHHLRDIALQGDYAYIATGVQGYYSNEGTFGLRIVHIANPGSPKEVGMLELGSAQGVAVAGRYAYVAVENRGSHRERNFRPGGLRVVDISDPKQPKLVATLGPLNASGVVVEGTCAYVTVGLSGYAPGKVRAVDISDPLHPVLMGTSPSRATLGYMKRRARRYLRRLAVNDPNLYTDIASRALA